MARVVALLRGVNIGKRRLPMAALRDGLAAAGASDVVTYVQSGNVVLAPPSAAGRRVRPWLEETIGAIAGFDVPVVVRTAVEMAEVVERNPFPGAGGAQLHVLFCDPAPPTDLLDEVDRASVAPEAVALVGAEIYLHLPNGMGRAVLPTQLERPLRRAGVMVTARNWNTVVRVREMVGEVW